MPRSPSLSPLPPPRSHCRHVEIGELAVDRAISLSVQNGPGVAPRIPLSLSRE